MDNGNVGSPWVVQHSSPRLTEKAEAKRCQNQGPDPAVVPARGTRVQVQLPGRSCRHIPGRHC